MKQILLFGAGKSATVLIDYLLAHAEHEGWELTIADANLQLALDKINNSPHGKAVSFDITDPEKRGKYISTADLVISMLPPFLHGKLATDCLALGKHLLTASYVDGEMRGMETAIAQKKLLFLCEMGLDPGIDHMSAMKLINEIREDKGKIISFKSHCGGLVAPESDDNPWHYKISWNPRNIVMAGKAGAVFKEQGVITKLDYASLFADCGMVDVPDLGQFAYYPNRDSLSYAPIYQLEQAGSFVRTTLRHPAFCKGWNYIVQLSLTDESALAPFIDHSSSYVQWLEQRIKLHTGTAGFEQFLESHITPADQSLVKELFTYLGLLSTELIPAEAKSSADILQSLVENRLKLLPNDRDMIIMLHEFVVENENGQWEIKSSLVVKGDDALRTAMAKTVGLPLAIAARLILKGQLTITGLHIPIAREIYEPVLKELENYGIKFHEEKRKLA